MTRAPSDPTDILPSIVERRLAGGVGFICRVYSLHQLSAGPPHPLHRQCRPFATQDDSLPRRRPTISASVAPETSAPASSPTLPAPFRTFPPSNRTAPSQLRPQPASASPLLRPKARACRFLPPPEEQTGVVLVQPSAPAPSSLSHKGPLPFLLPASRYLFIGGTGHHFGPSPTLSNRPRQQQPEPDKTRASDGWTSFSGDPLPPPQDW